MKFSITIIVDNYTSKSDDLEINDKMILILYCT